MSNINTHTGKDNDLPFDKVAAIIADIIIDEKYLEKNALTAKIKVHLKTLVNAKNRPAYDAKKHKNKSALHIATIEKKQIELKWWVDKMRELHPELMEDFYKQCDSEVDKKFNEKYY